MWQWFLVEGLNPEPWTASLASVGRRGGKSYVQFFKQEQLRLYQESLAAMFMEQNSHAVLHEGEISLVFYFWRRLNLNEMFEGRNTRTHVADATNLQKATEDALQGILYKNDRDIKDIRSHIVEQDQDTEPRILIAIGPYDAHEEAQEATRIAISLSRPDTPLTSNVRAVDTSDLF